MRARDGERLRPHPRPPAVFGLHRRLALLRGGLVCRLRRDGLRARGTRPPVLDRGTLGPRGGRPVPVAAQRPRGRGVYRVVAPWILDCDASRARDGRVPGAEEGLAERGDLRGVPCTDLPVEPPLPVILSVLHTYSSRCRAQGARVPEAGLRGASVLGVLGVPPSQRPFAAVREVACGSAQVGNWGPGGGGGSVQNLPCG